MYTTTQDYQEILDICIFEGERPSTKDNHLLGDFKIEGIERAKREEPEIEVTFALDANGIMNVSAVDKKTKAEAKCTISNACKGLSDKDIARMVEESERFAKEDAEVLRKIELKSEIESLALDLPSSAEELKEETLCWLDGIELATCPLRTLEARLKELEAASR